MTVEQENNIPTSHWRAKMHEVIFEAETPSGKLFDVVLLWAIIFSILSVTLESVVEINNRYGDYLRIIEWFFTVLFSVEYLLRIISVKKPGLYMISFFGIVDLLSIIPTYLSLFFAGSQALIVIRMLRLLRIFRVLKLARFMMEASVLTKALSASLPKITVFLGTVFIVSVIMGSFMYIIEGPENGFSSIPKGIYWTVVTLTTVGFGDITPRTPFGQFSATIIMLLGYGIIAVPTGIVSVELANATKNINTRTCTACGNEGHENIAKYCLICGEKLKQ